MTNILNIIEKEVGKGNLLIRRNGDFTDPSKVEKEIKKSFINDLKNDVIPVESTYEEYRTNHIEKHYLPVSVAETMLKELFKKVISKVEEKSETDSNN